MVILGDACMHNLLLTKFSKGNFVQVLTYAWFYESENVCAYWHAKSNFCVYGHFWDEIYGKFYM